MVAFLCCAAAVVAIGVFKGHETFPPRGVFCAEQSLELLAMAQQDTDVIPQPFAYAHSEVSHFRCAASPGFTQYEISGRDTAGHSFYVHSILGGRAASGSDSVSDFCYVRDGEVVTRRKISGREGIRSEGTCSFDSSFPASPSSQYEYGA